MKHGSISPSSIQSIARTACAFPGRLGNIPTAPESIYVLGGGLAELAQRPCLAVVGSRKITQYGKTVTAQLVSEVARAGVVIVSGLAYGVDIAAHRAALEAGGLTAAVLASGLDQIYPTAHERIAEQIVQSGGVLISEYPVGTPGYRPNFVARNRLVSGLCQAVLIIEAAEKSGTLHTARFALEQGRDVLTVPGNITSAASVGTNRLIKSGATPVTCVEDIFHVLGIEPRNTRVVVKGSTPEEQTLIDLLVSGETDGEILFTASELDISIFNQTLTMLEITGKIRSLGGNHWALS